MVWHTDHRAVVADVTVRLKASYHQRNHPMKVDVSRLRDEDVVKSYVEDVTCFNWPVNCDSQNVEGKWSALKDAIQSAAAVAIGPPRRRRTEWISNATLDIVEKRCDARLAGIMDEYHVLNAVRNKMIKDYKQCWF